ncbi:MULTISPECIES: hypothetical protein [Staphylococcus]|uniref:hypothetical protein n=1 Tax=Staphylococcus TaxID=1279 RepID=UPI0008534FAF|nr:MULTISPECIES: hypothetical protein [Staphylococcus]MCA2501764.1 hypothetical protein [Staphylococcus xylosus]MCE7780613.1 hypothetical protein [Staphylococcus xylosus]MEB5784502.1 hypothetical protein [Staphylococcus pseudoxylosus]OEK87171.1 hypothetical protein AST14_04890 [Staphylococcus xylosus]PTI79418.1 hypothetical protein BU098_14255 [Staphylococcus xylosus]
MEDLIIGAMFIVTVICYTVYKIDCNHVNKGKNNYPTDGLTRNDYDSKSSSPTQWLDNYKEESGRLSPKQEKAPKPPRKDSE